MGWCGLTFLGASPVCSPVPARTSLAPGVRPNTRPPRRTAAFVRSAHGSEDIAVASLNTPLAQTRHPLERQPASTPGVNSSRSTRPIAGQHRGTPAAQQPTSTPGINRTRSVRPVTGQHRRTSGRNRVESGRTSRGTGARVLTSHLPSSLNRHHTSESQLPKAAAAIRSRRSCPRAMSAVTGTEHRVRFHPCWASTAFSAVSVGSSHASMEGQRRRVVILHALPPAPPHTVAFQPRRFTAGAELLDHVA